MDVAVGTLLLFIFVANWCYSYKRCDILLWHLVRNKDLTWPEELSQLSRNGTLVDQSQTGCRYLVDLYDLLIILYKQIYFIF